MATATVSFLVSFFAPKINNSIIPLLRRTAERIQRVRRNWIHNAAYDRMDIDCSLAFTPFGIIVATRHRTCAFAIFSINECRKRKMKTEMNGTKVPVRAAAVRPDSRRAATWANASSPPPQKSPHDGSSASPD